MARDYRSSVDEQNNKDFSFGAARDQANLLAQMLQKKQEFEQTQALQKFMQQQGFQHADAAQQAGFEQQKEMVPIEEQSKKNVATFEHGLDQADYEKVKGDVEDNSKAGRKTSGALGKAHYGETDEDPLKYTVRVKQKDNDASTKAYSMYAKDYDGMKKGVDAAKEGLDAINDPTQGGSIGIARSMMIRTAGMNRYNGEEGLAMLPKNLQQAAKTLFQGVTNGWDGQSVKAGDDNNPMTPQQKAAAESFFRGHIANTQQQNEASKNKARGYLRSTGHFTPDTSKVLEDGFSQAGFDDYTKSILAPKPGTSPINQQSPLPKDPGNTQPAQPQQSGGIFSSLKNFLTPKPQQPSPGGFDPDSYLKGMSK